MDVFVDRLRAVAVLTEGATSVLVVVITAPIWLPTYVGIVAMRYIMGRDQSNDAV